MRTLPLQVVFLVLSAGLCSLTAAAADTGALPSHWYQLPEDHPELRDALVTAEPNRLGAIALQRILRANGHALDSLIDEEQRHPELMRGADDWRIEALILDMAVSASGALGVLMAKGEASAAMYWRRTAQQRAVETAVTDVEEGSDLIINGDDSRDDVVVKLEPIIRGVLATGDVKDEAAFRKNLKEMALSYQTLVQYLAFDAGREWYVSKLRLDFSVDITGKVHPPMTVGGGVRLRFEWEPGTYRPADLSYNTRDAEGLKRLIATLSQTLRSVSLQNLEVTGYSLGSMNFGLGIYGEGKFGVVKVSASVIGRLYLAKRLVAHPTEIPESETLPHIVLIEDGDHPEHRHYADSIHVAYTDIGTREHPRSAYEVAKKAFQKGLEKSVRIGQFLAECADRTQAKRWELYQIKTEFTLSLAGTVGIITIGGQGSLELAFQKKARSL